MLSCMGSRMQVTTKPSIRIVCCGVEWRHMADTSLFTQFAAQSPENCGGGPLSVPGAAAEGGTY